MLEKKIIGAFRENFNGEIKNYPIKAYTRHEICVWTNDPSLYSFETIDELGLYLEWTNNFAKYDLVYNVTDDKYDAFCIPQNAECLVEMDIIAESKYSKITNKTVTNMVSIKYNGLTVFITMDLVDELLTEDI